MVTTNFSRFLIMDWNDRVIRPPRGFIFDYADDGVESGRPMYCVRAVDVLIKEFKNPVTQEKYVVQSPRGYRVINAKINIIRA